ncbi:DedA family protein [Isoptericola sp. b490]|uniref:DedA family protein n=1 Tax=Actinotalea lenta TaxID=3064654 RepID=UPI002712C956|nr:DedA family protein [Isoptericola sp. b490]MDO8120308.1 DedA family protein [Isoptericola sp. b490]
MAGLAARVAAVLSALHGWPVYLVIGLLAFGESAVFVGLVLPGETSLVLGGVLAARGNLHLAVLMAVGVVAAVAGDQVGYAVGRSMGPGLRRSRWGRWIGDRRWDRAEAALDRHGPATVLLGRFAAVLRALVPALAGAGRMPYRRFLPANAAGGTAWVLAATGVGYVAGASWRSAETLLGTWGAVVAAVALGAAAIAAVRRRHRRKN